MTYHELVEKVRTALVVKADASKIEEHIAVQVNVTGEAEGGFYIEIKDGTLGVEPYNYYDNDFQLTADGAEILAVAQGKKTLETAITEGAIAHEGNWEKALTLSSIIPEAKKSSKKSKTEETVKAEEPAEGQLAFAEETTVEEPAKTEEVQSEAAPAEETPAKKRNSRKTKSDTAAKKTEPKKTTKKNTKKTTDK